MSFCRREKVKISEYFNYDDFRGWIESQPDDRIISRRRKDNNPMCFYLREVIGLKDVCFVKKGYPRRIKFELPSGRRCISNINVEFKELAIVNFLRHKELTAKEARHLIFEASKRYKKRGIKR